MDRSDEATPGTGADATGRGPAALRTAAIALADAGAERARALLAPIRGGEGDFDAATKSSGTDPVTVVDTGVEAHLRELVARDRPGDVVFGEEAGSGDGPAPAEGAVRWVVDPVDGTVNLLYGIPFTAVSVAAEVDGVVLAGAVCDIGTGRLWSAHVGGGTTVREADGSERALSASGCTDPAFALVGTGFSYDPATRAEQGRAVAALLPRIRDIRRCGSAALDLCMLAEGRLDAYYERCLKPWDHAAAALVAREAGAIVETSDDDAVPTVGAAPGVSRAFVDLLRSVGAV